jgi:hypothetical protein
VIGSRISETVTRYQKITNLRPVLSRLGTAGSAYGLHRAPAVLKLLLARLVAEVSPSYTCFAAGLRLLPPDGRGVRTSHLSGSLSLSLFVAALITSACSDVIPPCALPNGVASTSLNGAPPALLRALRQDVGELVAPGGRFDATDVIVTGQNRRLIFIWNVDRRWIVATEHGGFGYNDPIFAYDLSQDGRDATLVEQRIANPHTICSTASSLVTFEVQKP